MEVGLSKIQSVLRRCVSGVLLIGAFSAMAEDSSSSNLDNASGLQNTDILFALNSAVVQDEFVDVLRVHAAHLRDDPNRTVRIEGHADHRGSRQYNLALGERRAQSVRSLLIDFGADANQFDPVSFGEELRVHKQQTPVAMSRNRRVTLAYD